MLKMGVIWLNLAIICSVNGVMQMTLALLTQTARTKLGKNYGVYTLSQGISF
jgi:hypothetical protein